MEKEDQRTKRRRLVLVPLPYQGHVTPMLQLGTFLYNNGFAITVAPTRFNAPDPSKYPDFHFVFLEDGVSNDNVLPLDLIAVIQDLNANCRAGFREEMRKMVAGPARDSGEVAGIIHDELMYFCADVAAELELKSIVLRTTAAVVCCARLAFLHLNEEGYLPFKESMLEDPVPQLHPLRFKDLPQSLTSNTTKFLQLLNNMYSTKTPSAATIWNTMEWLEPSTLKQIRTKYNAPIFPIGPVHKMTSVSTSVPKEDPTCLEWLEKQPHNSVLYVAIGSIATLSQKDVEEMAWGLANSQQPFLWVIQPGSVRGSDWIELLPGGFEEAVGGRGCIVKWAPQRRVLKHRAVGGFWSHCGWNSTMESLSEGVPMLCKPCFGDQMVNARYLSFEWRVGIQLENGLERGEIERGIIRLMVEQEGQEMRERAKYFMEKMDACVKEEQQYSSYSYLKQLVSFLSLV